MSSGSYATRTGFREDQKPNTVPRCPTARYEDRGPRVFFTGCCWMCGRATTTLDENGRPRHEQIPAIIQ